MNDFLQAQKLFNEFQNSRNRDTLEEVLDILDELTQGDDKVKAENLKCTIDRFMKNEWRQIAEKYNIPDFQGPKNAPVELLVESATEHDLKRIMTIVWYEVRCNRLPEFLLYK